MDSAERAALDDTLARLLARALVAEIRAERQEQRDPAMVEAAERESMLTILSAWPGISGHTSKCQKGSR